MKLSYLATLTTIHALLFSTPSYAVIDIDAPTVKLQSSCVEASTAVDNCFDNTAALVSWVSTVRTPSPSASAPLKVDIGPGTFGPLNLTCNSSAGFTGNITFAGSGRGKTTIQGVGFLVTFPAVIENCTALNFSDLAVVSPRYGYLEWKGGGTSVWINVSIIGQSRGWVESSCGATKGNHYWLNSSISSSGFGVNQTYLANCDESWFFGSEIFTNAYGPLITAGGNGEVHVYGSNLRVDDSIGGLSGGVVLAKASAGGKIHIHGTGIDAFAGDNKTLTVLKAYQDGFIHANETAYNVSIGSGGTLIRTDDTGGAGEISAPYQWQTDAEAPFSTLPGVTYQSNQGSDTGIVTNTTDGHPHMLVNDSTCTSGWFDMVTASCR